MSVRWIVAVALLVAGAWGCSWFPGPQYPPLPPPLGDEAARPMDVSCTTWEAGPQRTNDER